MILEINGPDLLQSAKTPAINLEIYLYAFDDDGLVRDRMFQVVRLDLGKLAAGHLDVDLVDDSWCHHFARINNPPFEPP